MSITGNITGALAYQAHAKGEHEKARALYQKAMQQGLDKVRDIEAYGVLMMRLGEFEEAIKLYGTALKSHPTISERYSVRVNRAIANMKLGENKSAKIALEDINQRIELERVYESLGYFYVITDDEKAREYNEKAINLYPENVVILDNIGQYYISKGRPDIAREFLEEAYEINDGKADVLYHLALVEEHAKNKDKALKFANKAVKCTITPLNDVTEKDIEELIKKLS